MNIATCPPLKKQRLVRNKALTYSEMKLLTLGMYYPKNIMDKIIGKIIIGYYNLGDNRFDMFFLYEMKNHINKKKKILNEMIYKLGSKEVKKYRFIPKDLLNIVLCYYVII